MCSLDKDSLGSCSITCRVLSAAARYRLFSSRLVKINAPHDLLALSNSSVPTHLIKRMMLYHSSSGLPMGSELTLEMPCWSSFSNLRGLVVNGIQCREVERHFKLSLEALPLLENLSIQCSRFSALKVLMESIHCVPLLSRLSIRAVRWRDHAKLVGSVVPTTSLPLRYLQLGLSEALRKEFLDDLLQLQPKLDLWHFHTSMSSLVHLNSILESFGTSLKTLHIPNAWMLCKFLCPKFIPLVIIILLFSPRRVESFKPVPCIFYPHHHSASKQ